MTCLSQKECNQLRKTKFVTPNRLITRYDGRKYNGMSSPVSAECVKRFLLDMGYGAIICHSISPDLQTNSATLLHYILENSPFAHKWTTFRYAQYVFFAFMSEKDAIVGRMFL